MRKYPMEEDEFFIPNELYKLVLRNKANELDAYLQQTSYAKMALLAVDQYKEEQVSIMMIAARHGFDEVMRILLAHRPTQQSVELEGTMYNVTGELVSEVTALWCALDRGHFTVARILIDVGGADVNHGPIHPLLIHAAIMGRFDVIRFLVDNRYTDVNETVTNDENECSSLIFAASIGHQPILAYLIERGANLEYRTKVNRNTALTAAAMNARLESIQLLCYAGASANVKNRNAKTPLILVAENNNFDAVAFLLEHNHDEVTFNELELFAANSYAMSNNHNGAQESERMVHLLRLALDKRALLNIPKIVSEPIIAYNFQLECQSVDELEQIQHDNDRLYIEALLIHERIFLATMNEKLFDPLFERLSEYFNSN
ncbi:unnamed protein product [Rotaria sp. Silwood2]|nr:unnamed protein product [Rotaria sp. Silwood2]